MGRRGKIPLPGTRGGRDATAARLVPDFCVTVASPREGGDKPASFTVTHQYHVKMLGHWKSAPTLVT